MHIEFPRADDVSVSITIVLERTFGPFYSAPYKTLVIFVEFAFVHTIFSTLVSASLSLPRFNGPTRVSSRDVQCDSLTIHILVYLRCVQTCIELLICFEFLS